MRSKGFHLMIERGSAIAATLHCVQCGKSSRSVTPLRSLRSLHCVTLASLCGFAIFVDGTTA
jgi:hypothetical protein